MAWIKGSDTWNRRAPIAVDNTAGSTGNQYVQVVVPPDMEEFWTHVNQTDGRDVRITDYTGASIVPYALSGFNATTRTLTINIGLYSAPVVAMYQMWLYWDSATAASGASTVTVDTPKTGKVELGHPTDLRSHVQHEPSGGVRPVTQLSKPSADADWIYWDLRQVLQQYLSPAYGFGRLEEIGWASVAVTTGGESQSGMVDATKTRFIDGWVKTLIKAGSSGTDYTVALTVTTSLGRTLTARCWLFVRDVAENG